MMPNVDTAALAEMIFALPPEQRTRVTEELGMKDGPARPRTTRSKPAEEPEGTTYRVRRVPLR
ncbi:hypothetical protein OV320_7880 [Actinobacteria bacterium OV320]|jgi:hypothetical protein|nr:hypothetical protein OV320_7880 [Actinobacteria bacterium OV320]